MAALVDSSAGEESPNTPASILREQNRGGKQAVANGDRE